MAYIARATRGCPGPDQMVTLAQLLKAASQSSRRASLPEVTSRKVRSQPACSSRSS